MVRKWTVLKNSQYSKIWMSRQMETSYAFFAHFSNIATNTRLNALISCVFMPSDRRQLIDTDEVIRGVCCLPNDDIVVITDFTTVSVYNSKGEFIRTLNSDFRNPSDVAASKVNHDIYICDDKSERFFKEGKLNIVRKGEVIAVRADGQLPLVHYTYKGRGDGNERFDPVYVCTDYVGHVLIADDINHEVQILDEKGQFLTSILSPLPSPSFFSCTIAVDREGYIWVGGSDHVKVSRYLI